LIQLCIALAPTTHNSSILNQSLESYIYDEGRKYICVPCGTHFNKQTNKQTNYIYALDDHLQTEHNFLKIANFRQFRGKLPIPMKYCRQRLELSITEPTSQLGGLEAELWSPEKVTH
jgi:hypothetical protein